MSDYIRKRFFILLLAISIICTLQTSVFASSKPRMILAGSSSISMWHGAKNLFDDYKVINTAIGGTKVTDWLRIYKKKIVRYSPDVVLFYCGANDICDGHETSGVENAGNTKRLLLKIRKHLKRTKIFYISINHCNRNPGAWYEIDVSNRIMKDFCDSHRRMFYIDIVGESLLPDGTPDPVLFRADALHPSKQGFKVWNKVIGRCVLAS